MNRRKSLFVLFMLLVLSILLFIPLLDTKDNSPTQSVGTEDTGVLKPRQNSAGDDKSVLDISVSLHPSEYANLVSISQIFMREHSGITVVLENVAPVDQYTYLKKAEQIGDGPDLMLLDNGWIQEFAALGFLAPVSEYFTTDTQSQYIPTILEQVKWNGYLWGVPNDIDPYIMVWNKKKALENKWTEAPTNKQELTAWNKAYMIPEQDSYGVYFDTSDYLSLLSIYSAFIDKLPQTEKPFSEANKPLVMEEMQNFLIPKTESETETGTKTETVTVTRTETVAETRDNADWNAKVFAMNYPQPSVDWDPWMKLAEGKLAAMVTTVSAYRTHEKVNLELAALPVTSSGQAVSSWLKGRSYCLSSRSKNTEAAMEWIKSVTALQLADREFLDSGMLPVLIAGYSDPALMEDKEVTSYARLVQEGRVLPFGIDAAANEQLVHEEGRKLVSGAINFKQFSEAISKD
ncbi:MAG: extracellular solute-binding protein [Gorillibacterium sp.]|nr:extracellular solute-binding protein [Gorillibacterium sp.]